MMRVIYKKANTLVFLNQLVRIDYFLFRSNHKYDKEATGIVDKVYITGVLFKVTDYPIFISYSRINRIELALRNKIYYENK